jgi:hypothetical protein
MLDRDAGEIAPGDQSSAGCHMPDPAKFAYTFDKTSEIIESFLTKVGFTRFGLYAQDYGGRLGFRIVTRRPGWLEWLIPGGPCVRAPSRNRVMYRSEGRPSNSLLWAM